MKIVFKQKTGFWNKWFVGWFYATYWSEHDLPNKCTIWISICLQIFKMSYAENKGKIFWNLNQNSKL